MPKRIYTPDEKKLVRRLLLIHAGNVPIVQHLTGFPERTIRNWRERWDDDYELYTDALAENLISRANALAASQQAEIQGGATDSVLAESENRLAQFRQIRANLMKHATALSHNLALDDGQVNQRVHALSRLIDRVLLLDAFLDDQIPRESAPNRMVFLNEDGSIHSYVCELCDQQSEEGDEDKAQTEADQSGAMSGFTQEYADKLGVTLEELLEPVPKASLTVTDETPEHNHKPFEDIYGGIS